MVKIFTQGLGWSGSDEAKPPGAKTAADDDNDTDALEQQAEKLLKDAVKNLPKGLKLRVRNRPGLVLLFS